VAWTESGARQRPASEPMAAPVAVGGARTAAFQKLRKGEGTVGEASLFDVDFCRHEGIECGGTVRRVLLGRERRGGESRLPCVALGPLLPHAAVIVYEPQEGASKYCPQVLCLWCLPACVNHGRSCCFANKKTSLLKYCL
jgi:hypothetical protein